MWIGFRLWWKRGCRLSTVGFELIGYFLVSGMYWARSFVQILGGSILHFTRGVGIMSQVMGGLREW